MNSSNRKIQCVVVTPEKTELDVSCDGLTVPLFDGELGILPGRAPMVGRLGFGILKVDNAGSKTEWFVDGGFVQVTREAVYVLTDNVVEPSKLDKAQAEKDLQTAMAMQANSPESAAFKQRSLSQARAKLRLCK